MNKNFVSCFITAGAFAMVMKHTNQAVNIQWYSFNGDYPQFDKACSVYATSL